MQTRVESGEIRLACTPGEHLQRFLDPLLVELDEPLDERGAHLCRHDSRHPALPPSSLWDAALRAGCVPHLPPARPIRTKRLSDLERSPRWHAAQIADFLWRGCRVPSARARRCARG